MEKDLDDLNSRNGLVTRATRKKTATGGSLQGPESQLCLLKEGFFLFHALKKNFSDKAGQHNFKRNFF
jgi:hypothetical protein